ncbi:hypothetical protein BLNAU_8504 [Blattamonas nauphoetae]|uniref:Uncharacterized protein n=1 Tax=Blattamonas nauphoetae TaxID=2049346 RepID=A0ABQ9XY71_9EUKA|nr:hypothetical protein BLNAU_8504 [Blattamonas nauphoetae]
MSTPSKWQSNRHLDFSDEHTIVATDTPEVIRDVFVLGRVDCRSDHILRFRRRCLETQPVEDISLTSGLELKDDPSHYFVPLFENSLQKFVERQAQNDAVDIVKLPAGSFYCASLSLVARSLLLDGHRLTAFATPAATLPQHSLFFAMLQSSTLRLTNCSFSWIGTSPLVVVNERVNQEQSYISIDSCELRSGTNRLFPLVRTVEDKTVGNEVSVDVISTCVQNSAIVGSDGLAHSSSAGGHSRAGSRVITTSLLQVGFSNVSSQPKSELFCVCQLRQRMVGCWVWGSNNHLSGSTVRDMNSGGDFVSSNCSFGHCHTTSEERPSLVLEDSIPRNADDPFTDQTFDGTKGSKRIKIDFTEVTPFMEFGTFPAYHFTP